MTGLLLTGEFHLLIDYVDLPVAGIARGDARAGTTGRTLERWCEPGHALKNNTKHVNQPDTTLEVVEEIAPSHWGLYHLACLHTLPSLLIAVVLHQ